MMDISKVAAAKPGSLKIDTSIFAANYNKAPLGLGHNLHELDLFSMNSLTFLSKLYRGRQDDYFVAGSAPKPGAAFYSVPFNSQDPHQVLAALDEAPCRLLLKRPETYDPQFRSLLDRLFSQIVEHQPALARERIVRLESAVFITSAATTTPFHFDPEIAFFSQIAGEKTYHVFAPDVLTEAELENFYVRNVINIGQVDLDRRPPASEVVFKLRPGLGLHQPQNAPHWVETEASRSISYSFVFETEASRAIGRARSFNHALRRLGVHPSSPGAYPRRDALKAETLRLIRPVRRELGKLVHQTLGR